MWTENHRGHAKGPGVGRTGALIRLALTHPAAGPGFPTLLITSRERTSGPASITHLHAASFSLPLGQSKHRMTNGSDGKESTCNAGDAGSVLGSRSPGEGNGNPCQYSRLENSMDRGAVWATVHGVAKSQTQLSDYFKSNCKDSGMGQLR